MTDHENYAELVKKAQLGDKECLNRLAEAGRVRLHEYVFRITLQEDLTQDIVQESILEMFKVFNKLKQAERFWDWLEGIAFNKIRSHYGRLWRLGSMKSLPASPRTGSGWPTHQTTPDNGKSSSVHFLAEGERSRSRLKA